MFLTTRNIYITKIKYKQRDSEKKMEKEEKSEA